MTLYNKYTKNAHKLPGNRMYEYNVRNLVGKMKTLTNFQVRNYIHE